MVLEGIFKRLNEREYCRYNTNTDCLGFIDNKLLKIRVPELIEVFSRCRFELVTVAYFGNEPTRLAYQGTNIEQMLNTIRDLRLCSISENIAENAFSLFEGALSDELEKKLDEPCFVEQKFHSGSEHHFVFFLKKLISFYKRDAFMQPEIQLAWAKL